MDRIYFRDDDKRLPKRLLYSKLLEGGRGIDFHNKI